MPFLRHFLALFLLLTTSFSYADSLSIGEDIPYVYYEDKTASLPLEQFLSIPQESLKVSNSALSKGYTRSTFWIKVVINDEEFNDSEYWFEILPVFLDKIEFYYKPINSNDSWIKHYAGDLTDAVDWDLDYRAPVFILPKSPSGYIVIVKVSTSSSMILNINLWKPKEFIANSLKDNSFWIFFFGVFSFAAILFLVLAIALGKRVFWIIAFFSIVYFNLFFMHGYYEWFFGKSSFYVQHYLTSLLFIAVFAVVLWACSEILLVRENFIKVYKTIVFLICFILLQSFFVFFDWYFFAVKMVFLAFFIGFFILIFCFLYCSFKLNFNFFYVLLGLCGVSIMSILMVRVIMLNGWWFYPEKGGFFWYVLVAVSAVVVIGGAIIKVYKEKIDDIERKGLIRELNIERKIRFQQRQLVSTVSHEFRTSLAIISGAITNLKTFSNVDGPVAKRYERIERANERLIQLTDNCLADDRISSSSQALQFKELNLSELLSSATRLVDLSDHHTMYVTFNEIDVSLFELPVMTIRADGAMLQIAISNIFDNALKYMEEGKLNVDIYDKEGFYIIKVKDHGVGIEEGKEHGIFEKYSQVVRESGVSKPGVGFGLYVCKQIMLGHGGDVSLVENSSKGCCFELKIPKNL